MGKVNGWDVTLVKNSDVCFFQVREILYSFSFSITKAPTSNCQVSSIGHMDYLLQNAFSRNGKEDVHAIIKEAYKLIGVENILQIIIDVNENDISVRA